MGLNIKSERAHALVRQAAELSGLSQTAVVTRAVEEFLHRLTREQRAVQVGATLQEMRDLVTATSGPANPDFLYDSQTGLPQ